MLLPAGVDEDMLAKRLRSISAEELAKQAPEGQVRAGGVPMPVADFVKTLPGQQLMYAAPGKYVVIVSGARCSTPRASPSSSGAVMSLGELYQQDVDRSLSTMAAIPPDPPKRDERTAWGTLARDQAAAADVLGSTADDAQGLRRRVSDDARADPVARAVLGDKAVQQGAAEAGARSPPAGAGVRRGPVVPAGVEGSAARSGDRQQGRADRLRRRAARVRWWRAA